MKHCILDTGISVAYEPENAEPIVDFVFVHGLHGHPYKSWTRSIEKRKPSSSALVEKVSSNRGKDVRKNPIRRAISRIGRSSSKSSPKPASQPGSSKADDTEKILEALFWPAELLPLECPNSRILMYGYDSKITKYTSGATNKSSLLSHSKDLLFSLARHGVHNRPLVFIAHSLGGIIVKELQMLGRSSSSAEDDLRNIVESTAAIVFLGTPHRGSPEFAAIGESLRSIVSSLGMETTPANLDALGLKTTDLERAQEAFSTIWNKYDFRVKTFQESLSMTGIGLGSLGNKVVPDHSSLIGDVRERAETLQANHKDMSRYSGLDDPNYRKVGGELSFLYRSLVNLNSQLPIRPDASIEQKNPSYSPSDETKLDHAMKNYTLDSLWSPAMHSRYQDIAHPADTTCSWLFNHQLYQDWYGKNSGDNQSGLLWLKGKPGTGKSVLMKEAFRLAVQDQKTSNHLAAAFFFDSRGTELPGSESILFRSLLHQLLLKSDKLFLLWCEKLQEESTTIESMLCKPQELKHFFQHIVSQDSSKRIILYIDALDECDSKSVREQAYFWREITIKARTRGTQLSVCLSSRHFPNISLAGCPEIIMEGNNHQDIHQYIDDRFGLVNRGETQESPNRLVCTRGPLDDEEGQEKKLKDVIFQKSRGVFLWVVLVVEEVLRNRDDGKDFAYLLDKVHMVPGPLESLFKDLLQYASTEEKRIALGLFQWAILSASPLRLYEWHHILAFIRFPSLSSLSEWRHNIHFTKTDDQLERQIRSLSKGLVEVRRISADEPQGAAFDSLSLDAGAGSLNLDSGGTRVVQVIHESVRGFFLRGNGFGILSPDYVDKPISKAHMEIMNTCLNYIYIHELDALVDARNHTKRSPFKRTSSTKQVRPDEASHELERDDLNKPWTRHTPIDGSSLNDPRMPPKFDNLTVKKKALTSKVLEITQDQVFPVDIHLWMSTNKSALGDLSTDGAPALSIANSSISGLSQTLEDHPALLSYATQRFFTHAILADLSYSDPHEILHRLLNKKAWSRLKALREDIPIGSRILEYASQLGLVSWVADILLSQIQFISGDLEDIIATVHSEDNYRRLALNCPPFLDDRWRLSQFIIEDFKKTFPHSSNRVLRELELRDYVEYPEEQSAAQGGNLERLVPEEYLVSARRPRKQRSVESFGSASSHSGSIHGISVGWNDGSLWGTTTPEGLTRPSWMSDFQI
ncbi:unnamed protein product [Clonostachys solani]|uniref:Nephrocystin 3-like N-terminal domain-containing protein n=1 Tax=Clonostachys solani TaxID=160281 RepID=A0A9N9Z1D5_9HYPO|nr:unnamed protein product [Clonostachys solani]